MSAAWLLSRSADVTLFEQDNRLGGHSNTVPAALGDAVIPVDTGFIVYNRETYPNLHALFDHLGVETHATNMSFAISLAGGKFEYAGSDLLGLFAQKRNLARPRFWSMLRDIRRFYAEATGDAADPANSTITLGEYLESKSYGAAFCEDHLLPMAAAIWSAPVDVLRNFPFTAFVRFQQNHGLLQISNRPAWRSVVGGSRIYIDRLMRDFGGHIRVNCGIEHISPQADGVTLCISSRTCEHFDQVIIATHADQALAMLSGPTPDEQHLLGAFEYTRNAAILHCDETYMPCRRAAWASWNYVQRSAQAPASTLTVTYWMNRLQELPTTRNLFVTLNPPHDPREGTVLHRETYEHPVFNHRAMTAQRELWSLQQRRRLWFCGAYFGSGFHEDGLQAGLAVAEAIGGIRRPWNVPDESARIVIGSAPVSPVSQVAA